MADRRTYLLWRRLHLWLGLALALPLIVVGLTGSVLVWHDGLDELLHPERRPALPAAAILPPGAYLAAAAPALAEAGVRATTLRLPEPGSGAAVLVSGRAGGGTGGPPRSATLWLDPASAVPLAIQQGGDGFFRLMHVLHGSLMLQAWSGRQIVGWLGIVLTALAASGLWLWWPQGGSFKAALRWRRGMTGSANLHRLAGFWIAVPLALVALTGSWISFPAAGRSMVALVTGDATPPPQRRPGGLDATPLATPRLDADTALAAALAHRPGLVLASLALPTGPSPSWRLGFTAADGLEPVTLLVEDASGVVTAVAPAAPASAGEGFARLMRRWHDGQGMGLAWQVVVFLTGIVPALFAVTGLLMWLRRRSATARGRAARAGGRSGSISGGEPGIPGAGLRGSRR